MDLVPESIARNVEQACGIGGLYIVENESLERLLFDRNQIGVDFRRSCLRASRCFIRHLLDDYDEATWAELVILSKGLVYQLGTALELEAGVNLPTNLIATTRKAVAGASATVEVTYKRFDVRAATLVIGDTVASGATIVAALDAYREVYALRRLYLLSFAGATTGAHKISAYCSTNDIEVTFLYGLASFGLGDNGFDLSFLHPETITDGEFRSRASAQFSGRPVSAVGWDFGSQAMAPEKYRHLAWLEAELFGLHGSPCFTIEARPPDLSELWREAPAFTGRLSPGVPE